MKRLILAIFVLTMLSVPAHSGEFSGDVGASLSTTWDLGFEQKVDPGVFATGKFDFGDFAITGNASYVYTRKFFIPDDINDHAVNAHWMVQYEPGHKGILLGAGGRHSSYYTVEWDKIVTSPIVAIGWRWGGSYEPSLVFSYAFPEVDNNDEIVSLPDGTEVRYENTSETFSVSWGPNQKTLRWFRGYRIFLSIVEFDYRGERSRGGRFGIRLKIRSKDVDI